MSTLTSPPPPVKPAPAPADPDALIREARARRRRRRAALGIALLLAAGGAAAAVGPLRGSGGSTGVAGSPPSGGAATARAIERAARRAPIVEAGLTGPVGWAMNGGGLWLTADGGRSWLTSMPPHVASIGDPVARVTQVEFSDRTHGWIGASDVLGGVVPPGRESLRHMEVDRTSDGGRTWRWSIPPGCAAACGGASLSFLDARHGYALAATRTRPRLFATADGGASWSFVSRPPFAGAIRFLDARRGLGVGDPVRWTGPSASVPVGGGVLYRTDDGGRSWRRVELARTPATVDPPTFFGRRDGVVPVRVRDSGGHGQRLVVYVTRDGGRTWSARSAPPGVRPPARSWGIPSSSWFSAAGPRVWVVAGNRALQVTTDAGRTWRSVRPVDLPAGATIWQVAFRSARAGWAIVGVPRAGGAALVQTIDGGRRWTPLRPPVPRPRAFHPRPVCNSPCRRP